MAKLSILLLGASLFVLAFGKQEYRNRIPNGLFVPNPCVPGGIWAGVGHRAIEGLGERLNEFGREFARVGSHEWTRELCQHDSDGDGKTNGQELGDPNCVWDRKSNPTPDITDSSLLSHPGICEPINDPQCADYNQWLFLIKECAPYMGQPGGDAPRTRSTTTVPPPPPPVSASDTDWCSSLGGNDVITRQLRIDRVTVPSTGNMYYCQAIKVPSGDDFQIIAWDPIIDNKNMVHHIVVMGCDAKLLADRNYTQAQQCSVTPDECSDVAIIWASGQSHRCYGDNIGVAFGRNSYRTLLIQVNYNNPLMLTNQTDASGIKIFYQPRNRANDVAFMNVGQVDILIPPKAPKAKASATSQSCGTDNMTPVSRYSITAAFVHMRKLGNHARLIIRKKSSSQVVTIFDNDTNINAPLMQTWRRADAPAFQPGDSIELECTYKSDKSAYTFYGQRPADEICLAYVEIYPRPDKQFGTLYNFGELTPCYFPTKFQNCSDTGAFVTAMQGILANESNGFTDNCNSGDYPATNCSRDCYLFLQRRNLLGNGCAEGTLFRYLGTQISQNAGDVYRIQSNVQQCLYLTSAPAAPNASAQKNKNAAPAIQFATGWLALISASSLVLLLL